MATNNNQPVPSTCPVDHKARAAWLANPQTITSSTTDPPSPIPRRPESSCDSSSIDQAPLSSRSPPSPSKQPGPNQLNTIREISSIPRTDSSPQNRSHPANHEQETGRSPITGNWIYPSEEMFFKAMRRKAYDPRREDMKVIVPIHNAVNERAWKEIREWERGRGAERSVSCVFLCGGVWVSGSTNSWLIILLIGGF